MSITKNNYPVIAGKPFYVIPAKPVPAKAGSGNDKTKNMVI
jgi:cellulase/cellobiase CelA1